MLLQPFKLISTLYTGWMKKIVGRGNGQRPWKKRNCPGSQVAIEGLEHGTLGKIISSSLVAKKIVCSACRFKAMES